MGWRLIAAPILLLSAGLHAQTRYSVVHEGHHIGEVRLESRADPRGTRESETLVLDVQQGNGHRNVTRGVEALRDATGNLLELAFRFEGATAPIHWRGEILDRKLQRNAGDAAPVVVDLRGEPFLVAHRAAPLQDIWQRGAASLHHSLFDPAQLATLGVAAGAKQRDDGAFELLEVLGPSPRTKQETLIVDAQGRLQALRP